MSSESAKLSPETSKTCPGDPKTSKRSSRTDFYLFFFINCFFHSLLGGKNFIFAAPNGLRAAGPGRTGVPAAPAAGEQPPAGAGRRAWHASGRETRLRPAWAAPAARLGRACGPLGPPPRRRRGGPPGRRPTPAARAAPAWAAPAARAAARCGGPAGAARAAPRTRAAAPPVGCWVRLLAAAAARLGA
ncbi:uncharacterized protein LOC114579090 [Dendrobium catenatum]|uniref:uncharacterized protein LOC114579090 n=1 Tax=Dendrobium catenatum TaxID=906689 RepID=UPI00109FD465|nr:uncharacterized protein LOC114579090 [Dendrobium catenatum]